MSTKPRLADKAETTPPQPPVNHMAGAAKAVPKLHPSRLHLDESAHNTWAAHPEKGIKYEDMLDPAFWAHVAENKLRPNDWIVIYPADNTYRAILAVRASGRLAAHVAEFMKVEFPPIEMDVGAKFEVRYLDPESKWAVLRIKDQAVMQDKFTTQESAMVWLGHNARSLAA